MNSRQRRKIKRNGTLKGAMMVLKDLHRESQGEWSYKERLEKTPTTYLQTVLSNMNNISNKHWTDMGLGQMIIDEVKKRIETELLS